MADTKKPKVKMSEEEAINAIIDDCRLHHAIDPSFLSSPSHFYEFLYTEVKLHAESWGLDFEKAREAYEHWAKECHGVEFHRL